MNAAAITIIAIAATGVLMMRFRRRWLAKINIAFTNRITELFAGWLPGFGILTHVGRKSGYDAGSLHEEFGGSRPVLSAVARLGIVRLQVSPSITSNTKHEDPRVARLDSAERAQRCLFRSSVSKT